MKTWKMKILLNFSLRHYHKFQHLQCGPFLTAIFELSQFLRVVCFYYQRLFNNPTVQLPFLKKMTYSFNPLNKVKSEFQRQRDPLVCKPNFQHHKYGNEKNTELKPIR